MPPISPKHDRALYTKAVLRLIRAGARSNLRKVIAKSHPSDLARVFESIGTIERRELLQLIFEGGKLGNTLLEFADDVRLDILSELEDSMIARIITEVSSDDAADLLETLPRDHHEAILNALRDPLLRRQIRQLMSYDSSTAGGIMQTEFCALIESETVGNAVAVIRQRGREKPFFYLYTLDDENRLSGVVSMRQLLLSDNDETLESISNKQIVKVFVDEDQERIATLVYKYDLLAVPVVDAKNHLVGIITIDDVMDVVEEEASEDIYKLAGSNVEELMYGNRILKISRVRLPWLIISIATGFLTANIIHFFNTTLTEVIALAFFMPIITGMSGNVGTQSAAITVRGIAVGRIGLQRFWSTVFREMRVGFVLSLICGALAGIVGWVWLGNPMLGVVIGISMIAGITFAASSSSLMPILFSKMGVDPAVASGPLVTTINDCTSITMYLGIASFLEQYIR